jgi:molybdopterin-guanine dinucleotide biosynthesis protein A
VASDTPFFPENLARALVEAAGDDRETIVLAASNGRIHPVFGLWPVSAREALRAWLGTGSSLKVTDFTDSRKYRSRDFAVGSEGDPFFNINTPDDLAEAERRLTGAAS